MCWFSECTKCIVFCNYSCTRSSHKKSSVLYHRKELCRNRATTFWQSICFIWVSYWLLYAHLAAGCVSWSVLSQSWSWFLFMTTFKFAITAFVINLITRIVALSLTKVLSLLRLGKQHNQFCLRNAVEDAQPSLNGPACHPITTWLHSTC